MAIQIDEQQYRTIRMKSGATDKQVDDELTQLGATAPVEEFSEMERKVARDLCGSDHAKLKAHFERLRAYREERRRDAARRAGVAR